MTTTLPTYEVVKRISRRFSLKKSELTDILGISERTLQRYEKQNQILKPALADRLERFQRITQQALDLFEDEGETRRWLSTPKDYLIGKTPLEALATDSGCKKVEELLYRAEYGIFG